MATDENTTNALRAWAKGLYPLEAGVELLIRSFGGRLARPGQPWIVDGARVDAELISEHTTGALSGGEQRLLRIAASLLGGAPVNLHEDLPGLDREHIDLVLAAVAHATGSHQHSGPPVVDPEGRYQVNGIRMSFSSLPSLHPWPDAS